MNFNEYQSAIEKFDVFSEQSGDLNNPSFIAKILGLSGEAGEVAEKFKKIYRDKDGVLTDEDKVQIAKELGDVLWYAATISRYLGIPFEDIARQNIDKLTARLENNKLHGSGDNR
jgi:NTP pyrophosphatase (non-canonical NTP hydrolase)